MDVTRKRDSKHISNNSPSDKRRKIRNLSSELNGEYWKRQSTRRRRTIRRTEPAAPSSVRQQNPPPPSAPQHNFGVVIRRPTFDVGLPVVFGGSQPERAAPLQADEVEEPYSPTYAGFAPRRLIAAAPTLAPSVDRQLTRTRADYAWNFVPSWEALTVGARILSRVLTFPLAVARYLVDVAPETRARARQIEAEERLIRQRQIEAAAEAQLDQELEDALNETPNVNPVATPTTNTVTAIMSGSHQEKYRPAWYAWRA